MSKYICLLVFAVLSINLQSQTLDNTLGTEDRKVKKFGWFAEGPGAYEFFFVGGKRFSGNFDFYYENERLKQVANFKNGSYDGLVVDYNKDGSISSKGRYRNGNKVGKWMYYYDVNSYEEKVYSRREPNQVRKSLYVNSNSVLIEKFKTLRNMKFTKHHYEYHENGNLKLHKLLVSRRSKIYEIQEYFESTRMHKHYFLKFDEESEEWKYINEYKEYNKNGKLLIHEYH
jgi:antitoxin component YwqK of YwqJK toxin-antitoxin module